MSLGGKARAKFLCDSERRIECNACVTACKNENEVPWGINRRRVVTINDGKPGERSISVACMHCSDALVWLSVLSIVFTKQTTRRVALKRPVYRLRLLLLCVSVRCAAVPQAGNSVHEARWISGTFCAGGPEETTRRLNSRNTEVTVLLKESFLRVPSSARPKHCWPATVMMCCDYVSAS